MRNLFYLFLGLAFFSYSCGAQADSPTETAAAERSYLLADSDLPEYERNLDHRALMADWTEEFYHKGMLTYRTVCFNCHGNEEQPGSMPTAARFWQDSLKNGNTPYAMYQTLTKGFGLMPPQLRLTPQEKYEVIHFIREAFMKEQNPDQYFEVTDQWLNELPEGETTGP
jgi:cytochrome c5